ncbi:MAG: ubiquinol-cytochrome C chaperone family protein [Rhodospirillales bacterium]|nr:ubiquinol-cytochrome C chaperone family protein [Rhodospirillales bacterium]
MGLLAALFRRGRRRHERAGFALYAAAVAAARRPVFYTGFAVADTLDGRFDLVGLHAFLAIERLRAAEPPGPDLAQAVFDAMFADMDVTLREIGVGDLSVGKKMRTMWEAFHGRAQAYGAALRAADPVAALSEALARNVWRSAAPADAAASGCAVALARYVLTAAEALAAQPIAALCRGEIVFPVAIAPERRSAGAESLKPEAVP